MTITFRKTLLVITSLTLLLAFSGCSFGSDNEPSTPTNQSDTNTPTNQTNGDSGLENSTNLNDTQRFQSATKELNLESCDQITDENTRQNCQVKITTDLAVKAQDTKICDTLTGTYLSECQNEVNKAQTTLDSAATTSPDDKHSK